jgi:hypothetical protein
MQMARCFSALLTIGLLLASASSAFSIPIQDPTIPGNIGVAAQTRVASDRSDNSTVITQGGVVPQFPPTSISLNASVTHPTTGATGSATASASLPTGQLRVDALATTGLASVAQGGFGQGDAVLAELLFFQAPGNPAFIDIGVNFDVTGSIVDTCIPTCTDTAGSFVAVGGDSARFISTVIVDVVPPHHISGTVRVVPVSDYSMWIHASLTGLASGAGHVDLSNTGTISFDLPPGVTFTSFTGTFLTDVTSPVPEPATVLLMSAWGVRHS